ncbi:MAG TPA: DUF1080 domain-containing protein [Sedimentisphaerales bacterium]|nr:DUF1080 domain-containing protein [Sedimentisphaerales bacterium]HNU30279.1 DUF1080 domain-containing protein [Sedimentisphaerales bacterium]
MVRTTGRTRLAIVGLAYLAVLAGCHGSLGGKSAGKKTVLWNGKDFTGWTRVLADPAVDVNEVWRVREGNLYCVGKPNGYIRTTDSYSDYHLHVEWRWPEKPTNSGVLLHANGEDKVWPACIECQLKAASAGDLVLINGTGISVDGVDRANATRQFVVIEKKMPTSEVPAGQWNSYDIYCQGDTIRCLVNSVVQNEGTGASVTSGWICLQSEGSPIEFRNIYVESLD